MQSELVHVSRLTRSRDGFALGTSSPAARGDRQLPQWHQEASARTTPRDKVSDAVDRAANEALRAGQIVRRLRDFVARGETERTVESLPRLIEEASALALVGAKEHGIRVRFDFDREVELVLADRVQVQQVVLNLIRNAVDAMAEAERRDLVLSVAAVRGTWRGERRDTGPGIAPEVAAQLFQPFFTTKRTGNGRRPVHLADHRRGAWRQDLGQDNEGRGAIFRFTLQRSEGGAGRWRMSRWCM